MGLLLSCVGCAVAHSINAILCSRPQCDSVCFVRFITETGKGVRVSALEKHMRKNRLTNAALAKLCHCDPATISRVRTGALPASVFLALQIETATGVKADRLISPAKKPQLAAFRAMVTA